MFSLPWLELSRFKRHTITRLAMIVVAVIPAIYGGLYLASNWAPTDHLDSLRAAVVNEDTGANKPAGPGGSDSSNAEGPGTDGSGASDSGTADRLEAGDELVDTITPKGEGGFDWEETSQSDADAGLASGKYFAVLQIPADFSTRLVSTAGDDPEQAGLELRTDDAHSFIVGQLASTVLTEIKTGLNQTTTAQYVSQVYLGFNSIHDSISQAVDGAKKLDHGAKKLHEGTGTLVDGTGELTTGATDLHSGLVDLDDGAGALAKGASDLDDGAQTLESGTEDAEAGSKKLADGASQVADGTSELRGVADRATDRADELKDKADDLVAGARPKLDTAADDLEDARSTAQNDMARRIAQLESDYPDDPNVAALAKEANSLGEDLDSAHQRTRQAAEDARDLEKPVTDAVDSVMDTIHDADEKVGQLDDGAQQVSDGASDLHTGLVTLDDGAGDLATGTKNLASGAGDLKEGTAQAVDGAVQLSDGASQLDDGAHDLDDGAQMLSKGTGELKDKMAAGLGDIPTYDKSDRDSRSDVVALPIDAQKVKDNAVSAYGEGLAPFFISLALWIGGMITYMVLNAIPYRALASSAKSTRIAWAGYVPGALFAIAQVAVLYAVLTFVLDFTAGAWLATLAFSILIAAAFHAIHQFFVALLGGVGRLVALVLLMIQIASAGGTYPVQTAPGIFQAISPFMPMTHAVTGLRTLIAGGDMALAWQSAGALLLFTAIFLLGTVWACNRKRTVTLTQLHPSLSL